MKSICIYHGNCADGFSAAWVLRQAMDAEIVPGIYQTDPPDVKGRDVFMVDFSYKRPVLERMLEEANSLVVLDHHKTAEQDLRPLMDSGDITGVFDMERSGATITWDWFFPGQKPPDLLHHIEDRDLWRFALSGTREIQACVLSWPYELDVWSRLMATPVRELEAEGRAIQRAHNKDVEELVKAFSYRANIGGYNVPVASLPYTLTSDAAHMMAQGEPFAACYWDTPEGRVYSLRSADDGVDVSEIAKSYGGGGHRNAAGFKIANPGVDV